MITEKEQFEIDSEIQLINDETKDSILLEYPLEVQSTIQLNAMAEIQKALKEISEKLKIEFDVDIKKIGDATKMFYFINSTLNSAREKKLNLKKYVGDN